MLHSDPLLKGPQSGCFTNEQIAEDYLDVLYILKISSIHEIIGLDILKA